MAISKDLMYHKFRAYGFLKNLRFFDPFIILFFRQAGLSFLQIGVLFSVREIATNILEIPTGVVADAYGRRKAMLAAFASYLVSFALFYLVNMYAVYALAMVMFALGEALRSGTHKAMILEHLRIKGIQELRIEYYGHTRAASQLGSAVGALIAAVLVFYSGNYRIVFAASMVPYVLGLLLIISYPRTLDGDGQSANQGNPTGVGRRILDTGRHSLRMLLRKDILRSMASGATFDSMFKGTKDYLQPILEIQALSLPALVFLATEQRTAIIVGVVYFLLYLGTSYTSFHADGVVKRCRSLARAANLVYLVGIGLLMAAGLATWRSLDGVAIAGFLGFYLMYNLRRPMIIGYLAELIPRQTMATGLSVESQARTLLTAVLAPIVGFLADQLGLGLGLGIIGGIGLLLFPLLSIGKDKYPVAE
jgi:MFS family permease